MRKPQSENVASAKTDHQARFQRLLQPSPISKPELLGLPIPKAESASPSLSQQQREDNAE